MDIEQRYNERILADKDIGNFLELLYTKAKEIPECKILEFGTWQGSSCLAFALAAQENNGHVTSVDNRRYKIQEELKHNRFVAFAIQDSTTFTSNEKYDIILIDTIHSYDQVQKECKVIEPLLKCGTKIFFHDTVFKPEIIPAIQQFLDKHEYYLIKYPENKGMWEVEISDEN